MAFNSVPTQQRRPLPFLMSDSYSMIKAVGRKGVLIYCMVGRKGVLIYCMVGRKGVLIYTVWSRIPQVSEVPLPNSGPNQNGVLDSVLGLKTTVCHM